MTSPRTKKRQRQLAKAREKWRRWRDYAFWDQNGLCTYCGCEMKKYAERADPDLATRDHITPRSRGGRDTEENSTLVCNSCNRSKADMTVEEWLKDMGQV